MWPYSANHPNMTMPNHQVSHLVRYSLSVLETWFTASHGGSCRHSSSRVSDACKNNKKQKNTTQQKLKTGHGAQRAEGWQKFSKVKRFRKFGQNATESVFSKTHTCSRVVRSSVILLDKHVDMTIFGYWESTQHWRFLVVDALLYCRLRLFPFLQFPNGINFLHLFAMCFGMQSL